MEKLKGTKTTSLVPKKFRSVRDKNGTHRRNKSTEPGPGPRVRCPFFLFLPLFRLQHLTLHRADPWVTCHGFPCSGPNLSSRHYEKKKRWKRRPQRYVYDDLPGAATRQVTDVPTIHYR